MQNEYEAYHSDVQKIIDGLYKMNEILRSEYIMEAMQMLVIQSWQIQMYREERLEQDAIRLKKEL